MHFVCAYPYSFGNALYRVFRQDKVDYRSALDHRSGTGWYFRLVQNYALNDSRRHPDYGYGSSELYRSFEGPKEISQG